ncbi:MAG: hypothetical protein LKJ69_01605 [Lactobacillus sp.]|jgi:hypothetical protein|nr:hypothetical protein [Lactobacillus sp.]MCI2032079.1 hypothetical protein [Lactobacillus sp.]
MTINPANLTWPEPNRVVWFDSDESYWVMLSDTEFHLYIHDMGLIIPPDEVINRIPSMVRRGNWRYPSRAEVIESEQRDGENVEKTLAVLGEYLEEDK